MRHTNTRSQQDRTRPRLNRNQQNKLDEQGNNHANKQTNKQTNGQLVSYFWGPSEETSRTSQWTPLLLNRKTVLLDDIAKWQWSSIWPKRNKVILPAASSPVRASQIFAKKRVTNLSSSPKPVSSSSSCATD